MHTIKTQAHHLRTLLKARGLTLKHAEALELAAQANGYPNWQTAQAAERRVTPVVTAADAPAPGTVYVLHYDGSAWVYTSGGVHLGFFAEDGWDRDTALTLFTQNLLSLPPMGKVTVVHKSARVLDDTPEDLSPGEYLDELLEQGAPAFLDALPNLNGERAQTHPVTPLQPVRTIRKDELREELTQAFREVYGPRAAQVAVDVISDENNRGYSTYDSWRVLDAKGQELPVAWAFITAHLPEFAAQDADEAEYLSFHATDRDTQVEMQQAAAEVVFDLGNALSNWIDDLRETRDFILTLN
ncbi:glyoxalase superfamily protein [Deinococcus soli (ex Cha et al. 2016)]|uniref:Glyoxalase-related protein domain-containing protein n=2 Tax=Deinococcus soli (ex Cha et al. 2016) TaxID=1309411 RepID=A0AAE3XEY2_9DEIO|nr:glyoxalase superfamily protein [Deinococcus soli (ex Cha et al. 2016)]MDR6218875.1 hypothetical protein [Deinococcus soli (ex Cha et al. 2016)]MDR6328672.1 hypothetical protein [Deinococcus soli (ex Cha et al. 2016)]MDR6751841.1 hypothetical protein [Deinococcus soli (ex Cha et al. 2016)]